MTYDSAGRVSRTQQKDYHPLVGGTDLVLTSDYEFDDNGRMIKLTAKPSTDPNYSSAWQVGEFEYAIGYRIEETRPNDVVATHSFNTFGQKTKTVADSAGGGLQQTTEWGFDRAGRQTSIAGYTDEDTASTKQVTTYDYDDLGRVTKITYPDTKTIVYVYGDQGGVKKRTDQRDIITYYGYDKLRAMTLRTTDPAAAGDPVADDPNYVPDPDRAAETFTYDGLGRMLTAYKTIDANDVSLIEFAYNDISRVTDFDQTHFGGTERQIDYTYDQAGLLESTVYPDGSTTIDRTNTWNGRIDSLSRSSTELVAYDYIRGRVAKRSYDVPSVAVEFDYDNLGRVTEVDYGTSIAKFGYAYEADESNIDTKTFHHRTGTPANDYDYDDLDRLTDVEYLGDQSDVESFTMDDLGNRDGNQTLRDDGTVNFVVDDDTNRYTSIGGNSISHDDAGNLTVDKDGYQYTYDYEDRVVKIEDVSDVEVATYAYDALGRRIRKIDSIADETTLYYYNPNWQMLAEYDDANSLQHYFVYGNYIDEPLLMNDATNDYYYAHDHLYSVVALLEADGDVTERYEYDAYGTMSRLDPDFTAWSGTEAGNPYYFTGRRLDVLDSDNFKLMYYRHRCYDTYAGRFVQPDPLGIDPAGGESNRFGILRQYGDGLSLYLSFGGDPVNRIDSLGLLWDIERGNGSKADAEVKINYETLADLANAIGLEEEHFRLWLTLINDPIQTSAGPRSLAALKASDKICPGQKVQVPNKVIAYWGGWGGSDPLWGGLSKHFVDWSLDVGDLQTRGFGVLELEMLTASDLESRIEAEMVEKNLHGIFAWGHGGYDVFVTIESKNSTNDPTYLSYYASWYPVYKMALGVIWACHSTDGGARPSFSRDAIFQGAGGILIPLPFHLYGPRVKDIIGSGEQGTN